MKKFQFKAILFTLVLAIILPILSVFVPNNLVTYAQNVTDTIKNEHVIRKISGQIKGRVKNQQDALAVLNNYKQELGNSNNQTQFVFKDVKETNKLTVYRFDQYFGEYQIYGGQLNVSVNSDFKVTSIIGKAYKNINFDNTLKYSITEAREKVLSYYADASIENLKPVVIIDDSFNGEICYAFEVNAKEENKEVYVSAKTLEIVKAIRKNSTMRDSLPTRGYTITNEAMAEVNLEGEVVYINIDKYTSNITGNSFYVLGDKSRDIYVVNGYNKDDYTFKYYDSESGIFSDKDAVQAFDYLMKCYDFYMDETNFGEQIVGLTNPYGSHITLYAIVHFDTNYENAAFYLPRPSSNIAYFLFGDGDTTKYTDSFVSALDVVGHEYQHAITDSIVPLEYLNASGALSEAFSDIFGAVIEGYELTDPNFWRMGEDVYLINGQYFRDMSNPMTKGCTYNYNDLYPYCNKTNCNHERCDNGGVHYNCTLMTYATYIMYNQDQAFFTKNKILELWYQTLLKLTTTADFEDFAIAMLASAEELGYSNKHIRDIEFSFASVGLPGYTGVETWNGNSLTYLQGKGTLNSPFVISSVADLASVAYYVNNNEEDGKYQNARYTLAVDINLSDVNWISIGTSEYPFNGTFNGGGHTISGLNLTADQSTTFAGLFGVAGENAYISDINIAASAPFTSQAEYVGAIAGKLEGRITKCSSALNIIGKNVGGLVGMIINKSGDNFVSDCYVTADLEGSIAGGLVCDFVTLKNSATSMYVSGIISSSFSTGNISANIASGLVSRANGLKLINCITTSSLNCSLGGTAGAFVAELYFNNFIENITSTYTENFILSCKSTATFTGEHSKAGRIIGENKGDITEGVIYLENIVTKAFEGVGNSFSSLDQSNIKLERVRESTDNIFEGDFDFDSEYYYTKASNFSIIEGISGFDFTDTYQINSNAMPSYKKAEYWLDFAANRFTKGYGTKSYPYKISTANELALLANVISSSSYNTAYYELTNDIDLSGKLWLGIGFKVYDYVNGNGSLSLCQFAGHFNGNGHTIYNMTSKGAFMLGRYADQENYTLYEFAPSLFSVTYSLSTQPSIENTRLENVNLIGSNAAGVVSVAYGRLTLDNVCVDGGNISSPGFAGGLVARYLGVNDASTYVANNIINSCSVNANVSGNVAGGAAGYVANGTDAQGTLKINNFVFRGSIKVSGIDKASTYSQQNGADYFKAIGGGVVGITLIKQLCITNSLVIADVISYGKNPYIAGFVGCVGVGDSLKANSMSIDIKGCKHFGNVNYIFDEVLCSGAVILGGSHIELGANVTVSVDDKTYTNKAINAVNNNNANATINSMLNVSSSKLGEEDFDIYNSDYYSNNKYFDSSSTWSEQDKERMFYIVKFVNYNNEVLQTVTIKSGESAVYDGEVPTRQSTVMYDYSFKGWSVDLDDINYSQSIYAEYDATIRSYTVNYYTEKGELIVSKVLDYGTLINKEGVKAPDKKSNFLFNYEFLYFDSANISVVGDMNVYAVYKQSLTGSAIAIIFFAVIIGVAIVAVTISKVSNKRQ